MSANSLMAVKVLILVAAGAAFVWWQLHDLAQEEKRPTGQNTEPDAGQDQSRH